MQLFVCWNWTWGSDPRLTEQFPCTDTWMNGVDAAERSGRTERLANEASRNIAHTPSVTVYEFIYVV